MFITIVSNIATSKCLVLFWASKSRTEPVPLGHYDQSHHRHILWSLSLPLSFLSSSSSSSSTTSPTIIEGLCNFHPVPPADTAEMLAVCPSGYPNRRHHRDIVAIAHPDLCLSTRKFAYDACMWKSTSTLVHLGPMDVE